MSKKPNINKLKNLIDADLRIFGSHFLTFVKSHTMNHELINKSILLNLKLKSYNPSREDEIREQYEELIKKLEAELSQMSDTNPELMKQEISKLASDKEKLIRPIRKTAVKCHGITKKYSRSDFKLSDVNLSLKLGQIIGIVGQNAQGKTTLLRMIAGQLKPSSGELTYFGDRGLRSYSLTVQSSISYVPQSLPVYSGSLRDHLRYRAAESGTAGDRNEAYIEYLIHRLGLYNYIDLRWNELSGGYKLRFALAEALAKKPRVLILDEPLANLDVVAQLNILNDLRNLADDFIDPISIILSSQNIFELEYFADKIGILRGGKIEFRRKVEDCYFEFQCDLDYNNISEALNIIDIKSLKYDGYKYILRTKGKVRSWELLNLLGETECELRYFRNISDSVKRFLE